MTTGSQPHGARSPRFNCVQMIERMSLVAAVAKKMMIIMMMMMMMMMMTIMMTMMQIDSYSAFYDNGHMSQTELHDVLTAQNISTLYLVGLATDYCVFYTAMDASSLGLDSSFALCR